MVRAPGTSNCPSCDGVVSGTAAICPTCGFRVVATTDAQVVLGLLRGGGPPAADLAPTERIPLDRLAAAGAPVAGRLYAGQPPVAAPAGPEPDPLSVDSLFVRQDQGPTAPQPGPPTAPRAADRPGLLDRLGDLPLPGWLAGRGGRPGDAAPSRLPLLIALGLVVLILSGTVFAIAGLAGSLDQPRRSAAKPAAPVAITLVPVDAGGITAKASSTLHPESRGYQARNTLDGRDNTAWNSDGDRIGDGVGVTLRWSFDRAQDIRRITVRNGYVRSSKDAEVFRNNGRLKRVKITTDGTSSEWTLKDTPDQQSLTVDLGSTSSVTFEVLEVYSGARYKDLALTDISFDAAG